MRRIGPVVLNGATSTTTEGPLGEALRVDVRDAVTADSERWDRFVTETAPAPALNLIAWKRILEDTYGVETHFWIAEDDAGEIRGVLPTYVNPPPPARASRLYSLRFGLVADDAAAARALMDRARALSRNRGISAVRLCSGYAPVDCEFPEERRTTLVMRLGVDEEAAWHALRDKTRNMVRKAERGGLTLEWGRGGLPAFYEIYAATLARKGAAIHSRRFFETMFAVLGERADLLVAKRGGESVAGTVVLRTAATAMYPFQAARPDVLPLAPNPLMVWTVAKDCIARGIGLLDMGEAVEGGSIYRFKKNFGGEPVPVYYYASDAVSVGQPTAAVPQRSISLGRFRRGLLAASPLALRKRAGIRRTRRGRII